VTRPWFEAGHDRLARSLVIVPTRGQALALKQRCLEEGVALLGVDFLTPGLVRRKWKALGWPAKSATAELISRQALDREILLLGLRSLVTRRLAGFAAGDPAVRFWRSLDSDLERALDDFDELLRAGFRAADFPSPQLRELFESLEQWVEAHGGALAPRQAEEAALHRVAADAPLVASRILAVGLGPEMWGEFFTLAALLRRCADLTVILPEPEFRGQSGLDERWVEIWEQFLGVNGRPLDEPEPTGCGAVAELWRGGTGSTERASWLVGRTRTDEMILVANQVGRLLASGAQRIAVIFPRADAAHLRLVELLQDRGIPYADLLGTVGAAAIDVQIHHALLSIQGHGGRIEELLALWPLLHALNLVAVTPAAVRHNLDHRFDECQAHRIAAYLRIWEREEDEVGRELSRIAGLLMPIWPESITLADALDRFRRQTEALQLALPASWPSLLALSRKVPEPLPTAAVIEALRSSIPRRAAATGLGGGSFARVTLTTRRRAAGVAWSHVVWTECNSGVWPERREPGCWLNDEERRDLNVRGRFSLGLWTEDDLASLDRALCVRIARDTREGVVFSAAQFDEEEPELPLAPNAWLERVLARSGALGESGLERGFADLACSVRPNPPAVAEEWSSAWHGRRNPERPFDTHFLAGAPPALRPRRLSAKQIERGLEDPAVLWFEAVLGVRRVEWRPLQRARKRALGQLAHRILATALRGEAVEGEFRRRPDPAVVRQRLEAEVAKLRTVWPDDRYWESLAAELGTLAHSLAGRLEGLGGEFVAVESRLPRSTAITLEDGEALELSGRLDLALLDRPSWAGAVIEVVDFKTGSDQPLSVSSLARGASLQLGVYLLAVQVLGASRARVWMLKPDQPPSALDGPSVEEAIAPLMRQLGRHLATGVYGARTPDRTEYAHGWEWPLACPAIPEAVLERKYELTFSEVSREGRGVADD